MPVWSNFSQTFTLYIVTDIERNTAENTVVTHLDDFFCLFVLSILIDSIPLNTVSVSVNSRVLIPLKHFLRIFREKSLDSIDTENEN